MDVKVMVIWWKVIKISIISISIKNDKLKKTILGCSSFLFTFEKNPLSPEKSTSNTNIQCLSVSKQATNFYIFLCIYGIKCHIILALQLSSKSRNQHSYRCSDCIFFHSSFPSLFLFFIFECVIHNTPLPTVLYVKAPVCID